MTGIGFVIESRDSVGNIQKLPGRLSVQDFPAKHRDVDLWRLSECCGGLRIWRRRNDAHSNCAQRPKKPNPFTHSVYPKFSICHAAFKRLVKGAYGAPWVSSLTAINDGKSDRENSVRCYVKVKNFSATRMRHCCATSLPLKTLAGRAVLCLHQPTGGRGRTRDQYGVAARAVSRRYRHNATRPIPPMKHFPKVSN